MIIYLIQLFLRYEKVNIPIILTELAKQKLFGRKKISLFSPSYGKTNILRSARATWLNISLLKKILVSTVLVLFGSVIGFSLGYSVLYSFMLTSSIIMLLGVALSVPNALKIILATILWLPIFVPLSAFMASYAKTSNGIAESIDIVGVTLNIVFFYIIAIVIAIWKSYGKTWVTIMLIGLSVTILGTFLVYVYPQLGLNAAKIAMFFVLFIRCGWFRWIYSTIYIKYLEKIKKKNIKIKNFDSKEIKRTVSFWGKQDLHAQNVIEKLAELPDDFYVFLRLMPKSRKNISMTDIVVVGPTGCFLISIVGANNSAVFKETTQQGVLLGDTKLNETAGRMYEQSLVLNKIFKKKVKDYELIISPPTLIVKEDTPKILMLYAGVNPLPISQSLIVPEGKIVEEIISGKKIWSTLDVKKIVYKINCKTQFVAAPKNSNNDLDKNKVGEKVAINTFSGIMNNFIIVALPNKKNSKSIIVSFVDSSEENKNRKQKYSYYIGAIINKTTLIEK